MTGSLFLGCPIFANPGWVGRLFPKGTKRADFLRRYSQVFNTVEGNSTFYGLPARSTVERWIEETPDRFRFALKFPRAITHGTGLLAAPDETRAFLRLLGMLADHGRLGPSFLQLPPNFSGRSFAELAEYLHQLPNEFPYTVEVRHRDYFGGTDTARRLNEVLTMRGADRVILDSRPLHHGRAETEEETAARRRKPNVPVEFTAIGRHPFVRLIGRDHVEEVEPWIDEWAEQVAAWLAEGRQPYFFAHAPDDTFAPDLARLVHHRLRSLCPDLEPLPILEDEPPNDDGQLSLF